MCQQVHEIESDGLISRAKMSLSYSKLETYEHFISIKPLVTSFCVGMLYSFRCDSITIQNWNKVCKMLINNMLLNIVWRLFWVGTMGA